jgi:cell division protein FtsL
MLAFGSGGACVGMFSWFLEGEAKLWYLLFVCFFFLGVLLHINYKLRKLKRELEQHMLDMAKKQQDYVDLITGKKTLSDSDRKN